MATAICQIQVGDKKYYLSHNEEDVYYSTSNKTGGSTLKGVKFKSERNEFLNKSDNTVMNKFEIAEAIRNSK